MQVDYVLTLVGFEASIYFFSLDGFADFVSFLSALLTFEGSFVGIYGSGMARVFKFVKVRHRRPHHQTSTHHPR